MDDAPNNDFDPFSRNGIETRGTHSTGQEFDGAVAVTVTVAGTGCTLVTVRGNDPSQRPSFA
ncbi:hypothetical protein [Caballeronia sp. BR00000012568055]|uniref:hypothetical protein n=1 Tax=Caballeronia sp. BR00000012568055 TaxID=2918761 RepID=UPI0023F9CDF7|nr:hypothetical protein [Caballeronia sp. BR00000012568055]